MRRTPARARARQERVPQQVLRFAKEDKLTTYGGGWWELDGLGWSEIEWVGIGGERRATAKGHARIAMRA
jgi:hypothetical protein